MADKVKPEEHYKTAKERGRTLARLVFELRKIEGNENRSLESFIHPSEWNNITRTIEKYALDEEKNVLSRKIGYCLDRAADQLLVKANIEGNYERKEEIRSFKENYKLSYTNRIAAKSLRVQKHKHLNKDTVYLSNVDVSKFINGLKKDVLSTMRDVQCDDTNSKQTIDRLWLLQELCMVYLASFNRKRLGEVSKAKVQNFLNAKRLQLGKNDEVVQKLDKLDRFMLSKNLLMQIIGKADHHVPVLIPKELEDALDVLIEQRTEMGIPVENEYLFPQRNAKPGGKRHMDPWHLFRKYAKKYGLKHPKLMRGTNLR